MQTISSEDITQLLNILDELIDTIEEMLKIEFDYFLIKNKREANDQRRFLLEHNSLESFQSLNKEVAERYVFEFSCGVNRTELDLKRRVLIEDFLTLAGEILNKD